MAEENDEITQVAEEEEEDQERKPRSRKPIIISLLVVLLAGLGVGGYFFARWMGVGKLFPVTSAKGKGPKTDLKATDDSEVKQVVELQPFIVNLSDRNEARYLRMSISLGLAETGELKPDPLFTTKVRNAILAIVTTKTSDQILTVEGKDQLRKEMLTAARGAASKPEILSIYITDFIVQM